MYKKISALFLSLVILIVGLSVPALAAEKTVASKTIGIVFDNSGSMYLDGKMDWCRATYATEIFASMMNDGDTMYVYPMHNIDVEGQTFTKENPLKISGPLDSRVVEEMFTPDAQGTPIETVDCAYNDLKGKDGEKWLIVLTDGDRFSENMQWLDEYEGDTANTKNELTKRLNEYRKDMNIIYLGVGEQAVLPDITSTDTNKFYVEKASDSNEILNKLSSLNGLIFGRDAMNVSGDNISTDLSLSKLIVVIQGENISDVEVVDENGSSAGTKLRDSVATYSTKGSGNWGGSPDTSLQSMMVTYTDVPAGEYRISYTGTATKTDVYYEPDVSLRASLKDEDGNIILGNSKLYAGDYDLGFGLVDNKTEELSKSDLLGDTNYKVTYIINGEEFETSTNEKIGFEKIPLKAGDSIDGKIAVDYLSGYHQEKRFDEIGWPVGGYVVETRIVDSSSMTQIISYENESYMLNDFEDNAGYFMEVEYDGEKITGDELAERVTPYISCDNENIEPQYVMTENGYDIRLLFVGDALDTELGEFNLITSFDYTNDDGQTGTSSEKKTPFNLGDSTFELETKIIMDKKSASDSELAKLDPVLIQVTKNGEPLTAEEAELITPEIDTEGIAHTNPVWNEDKEAFEFSLLSDDENEIGKHNISAKTNAYDDMGRLIESGDEEKFEINKFPWWFRWAIIGLILLLILIALAAWFFSKAFPKSVNRLDDTYLALGGKQITNNAKVSLDKGVLNIRNPKVPSYPTINCSARITVKKVDRRYKPSSKRRLEVIDVRPIGDVESVVINGAAYTKGTSGKYEKGNSKPTIIKDKAKIVINGTCTNNLGKKKVAVLSQRLRFR
ncbi:MAG: hypothetical protein Q4C42_10125 [Clostridia bacterium]|nr:hypothetical protein [Clostridia bacterium]